MRYFIREDGETSVVDELTNPTYASECLAKSQDQVDEQGNIIEKATWKEIPEEEYLALQPKEPSFEPDPTEQRKAEIKTRLNQLSEDIVQHNAGENVPDITKRKAEFIMLHNELRELEGKTPRSIR